MNVLKLFLAFFTMALLISCANVSSNVTGNFEGGKKEVYIQPGSLRVLGPIKETFRDNGWVVNEFDKTTSRYFVHLNTKKVQLFCLNENSELEVELVLLDQDAKESIFSITAQTCDNYTNLRNELGKLLSQLD